MFDHNNLKIKDRANIFTFLSKDLGFKRNNVVLKNGKACTMFKVSALDSFKWSQRNW